NLAKKTTAAAVREYRWDCRDTLTAAFENNLELGRYDYDRNLQRLKRAANGLKVEYVLDDKFVLLEGDGATAGHPSTRRYHYATSALADTEISSATRVTAFINNDALGSASDFTSLSGSLTAGRQYDAWGSYRNS